MSFEPPKIVKDLHEFSISIFHLGRSIPKHLRPSLASRMENMTLDALLEVRRFALLEAKLKPLSVQKIQNALDALEAVACILELVFALHAISDGLFGQLAEKLETIRRQLHGLRKKYVSITAAAVGR